MFKKISLIAMVLMLCGAVFVISDTTFSWSNSNQSGTLTYTGLALVSPTVDGSTVVTAASAAQSDTNTTTAITSYTPAFVGQVLIGSINGGTNAIWNSRGTTTNDWQQIAP